jgi:hypothetical protein
MATTPNEIGGKGKSVNMSEATRALNIAPDPERLAKYDDYPAKARKIMWKQFAYATIFAVMTVALIATGHIWWAILPVLPCLWCLWIGFLHRNASPQAVYESGLLCGGIIVNETPLQIAVMAPMQTSETDPTCWGVQCFDIKELPLHNIKRGERVPCAVMFGGAMPFSGLWSMMEPHPVCWATADASLVEQARRAIGEDEWRTLETLAPLAAQRADRDYSKEAAYFNEDLSPRIDLQEKPENRQTDTPAIAGDDGFMMENILWSFTGGKRGTQEQFVEELVRYNLETDGREIDPDEIVETGQEIIITFAYEEDGEQKDGEFRLTADCGNGFTAGELLYKIHNRVVEHLEVLDYHLFRGLPDNGTHDEYPGIPFYYLNLGS